MLLSKPTKLILFCLLTTVLLLLAFSPIYALYYRPTISIKPLLSERIVVENARILNPAAERLSEPQYIVIEKGLIKAITSKKPPHKDAELRIDSIGKVLSPGLIDMHVHIFDRSDLLLNLAHGITTIRSMHGLPQQLAFKKDIKNGHIPGPRMIIASPIINQRSQYSHSNFHYFAESPEHARALVKHFHRKGYDLIKFYDGIQQEIFNAITNEAEKLGIAYTGHPSFFIPLKHYLDSGAQSLEHIEMLYQAPLNYSKEPQKLSRLITEIKAFDMPVTATLVNYNDLAQIINRKQVFTDQIPLEYMNPYFRLLTDNDMQWALNTDDHRPWIDKAKYLQTIAYELYAAGVPMLLGSDAGAGYTLHGFGTIREMIMLKQSGISNKAILASGTINASKALALDNIIGSIEVGKKADFVICNKNPRTDFTTFYQLAGIIQENTYYNQKAIQKLKQQAKQHMNLYEVSGWFIINFLEQLRSQLPS